MRLGPSAPALIGSVSGRWAFQGCLGMAVLYPGNQTQSQVFLRSQLQPSTEQSRSMATAHPQLVLCPLYVQGAVFHYCVSRLPEHALNIASVFPYVWLGERYCASRHLPWAYNSLLAHTPLPLSLFLTISFKALRTKVMGWVTTDLQTQTFPTSRYLFLSWSS